MNKFQIKLHSSLIKIKCFTFISYNLLIQITNEVFFFMIYRILINVGTQNMYVLCNTKYLINYKNTI